MAALLSGVALPTGLSLQPLSSRAPSGRWMQAGQKFPASPPRPSQLTSLHFFYLRFTFSFTEVGTQGVWPQVGELHVAAIGGQPCPPPGQVCCTDTPRLAFCRLGGPHGLFPGRSCYNIHLHVLGGGAYFYFSWVNISDRTVALRAGVWAS